MNADLIFRFLKDINVHNDRTWFKEHRDEYESARIEFEDFIAAIIVRISIFDKTVCNLQPKDCTYRIYRDIRFSEDKSPFKRHIGGYINAHGKKSPHSGYYIHLEPDNCMICSGSICVTSSMTKALRRSVFENIDEFVSIVEDKKFQKYFPTIGFEHLKVTPAGYPCDFKYLDYLKCKDYDCCMKVPNSYFYQPDLLNKLSSVFKQMKRLNDFVNMTIDDME